MCAKIQVSRTNRVMSHIRITPGTHTEHSSRRPVRHATHVHMACLTHTHGMQHTHTPSHATHINESWHTQHSRCRPPPDALPCGNNGHGISASSRYHRKGANSGPWRGDVWSDTAKGDRGWGCVWYRAAAPVWLRWTVAVCCSALQCIAVCCSVLRCIWYRAVVPVRLRWTVAVYYCVLQCVAVFCIVSQCVAVNCSVLQCVAVCCSVGHRAAAPVGRRLTFAVGCCVLQCIDVCCSVLLCVRWGSAAPVGLCRVVAAWRSRL